MLGYRTWRREHNIISVGKKRHSIARKKGAPDPVDDAPVDDPGVGDAGTDALLRVGLVGHGDNVPPLESLPRGQAELQVELDERVAHAGVVIPLPPELARLGANDVLDSGRADVLVVDGCLLYTSDAADD